MDKSPDAFRTISEVAEWLGVPAHVLRFWESKFSQVKPVKRAGGRRYYRPADMALLGGIKALLHDDGMTIKGVQKLLREKGVAHVAGFAPAFDPDAVSSRADAAERPAARTRRGAENVVPFQAREDAAEPEPEPIPEPEPEPELDTAPAPEAKPLPSFLTQPLGGGAPPPPPKPRIVEAPDPAPDDQIAAQPGALARLGRITQISPEEARAMAPLISRLAVLRDRMAGSQG